MGKTDPFAIYFFCISRKIKNSIFLFFSFFEKLNSLLAIISKTPPHLTLKHMASCEYSHIINFWKSFENFLHQSQCLKKETIPVMLLKNKKTLENSIFRLLANQTLGKSIKVFFRRLMKPSKLQSACGNYT